jgi:hypothetical protein
MDVTAFCLKVVTYKLKIGVSEAVAGSKTLRALLENMPHGCFRQRELPASSAVHPSSARNAPALRCTATGSVPNTAYPSSSAAFTVEPPTHPNARNPPHRFYLLPCVKVLFQDVQHESAIRPTKPVLLLLTYRNMSSSTIHSSSTR